MAKSTAEIMGRGMRCLTAHMGIVEAEEFIFLVIREKCNENLKIEIRLKQG
ncbi:MAG: hypothetical protein HFG47_00185 [Lachnospiraceae bacterium]|nr:hypothetical protein [Lachnospiraceae bacterium]